MSASFDGWEPGGGWNAGGGLWVGLGGSPLKLEAVAPVHRVVPAEQHRHREACFAWDGGGVILFHLFSFRFSPISILLD